MLTSHELMMLLMAKNYWHDSLTMGPNQVLIMLWTLVTDLGSVDLALAYPAIQET